MKIAIVGTRGIPNRYGGFERFAEQISSTFADHGHQVTVYCRRAFTRPDDVYDKRVRRVIVPSLHQKHLDTWVSTFFAAVHVAFTDNDIVLLCNVANSPFAYIPRLFGKPVVLNVDGLDRKREKWAGLGAQVLHFCEWMSSFSSSQLVTDAKAIHDYYLAKYKSESVVIGYGSEMPAGDYNLNGLNLESGPLRSVRQPPGAGEQSRPGAAQLARGPQRLAAGDGRRQPLRPRLPGASEGDGRRARALYRRDLRRRILGAAEACRNLRLCLRDRRRASRADRSDGRQQPGALSRHAGECRRRPGDAAVRYDKSEEDLREKLQALLDDATRAQELAARAKQRADALYRWEAIAEKYERVFAGLVGK